MTIDDRIKTQAQIALDLTDLSDAGVVDLAWAMSQRLSAQQVTEIARALATLKSIVRLDRQERALRMARLETPPRIASGFEVLQPLCK